MIKVKPAHDNRIRCWTDISGRMVVGKAISYADSTNFRVYSIQLRDGSITLVRI